jgi:hypothetical protein
MDELLTDNDTRYIDIWRNRQNFWVGVLIAVVGGLISIILSTPSFDLLIIIKLFCAIILSIFAVSLLSMIFINISRRSEVFNTYLYLCRDPPSIKLPSSENHIDSFLASEWAKAGLLSRFFKGVWEEWWTVIDIVEFAVIRAISGLTIKKYGLNHAQEAETLKMCEDVFKDNKFVSFKSKGSHPTFWSYIWLPEKMEIKRKSNSHWRVIIFENPLIEVKIRILAKGPWFDHPTGHNIRNVAEILLTPEQFLNALGKDVKLNHRLVSFEIRYEVNLKLKAFFSSKLANYITWAGGVFDRLEKALSFEKSLKDRKLLKDISNYLVSLSEERIRELEIIKYTIREIIPKVDEKFKKEDMENEIKKLEEEIQKLKKPKENWRNYVTSLE